MAQDVVCGSRDRPADETELTDGSTATEAMIEAGGEIIHAMFAGPGEVDRFNSRYAAERVFRAMMEARVYDSLCGS